MSQAGRELVRAAFLGREVERPPFVPFLATAAGRFMQVPVLELLSDPTSLANSLQSCQQLFGYDGVVNLFDTTLEAEACGCELEWPDDEPPRLVSPVFTSESDLARFDPAGLERRGRLPVVTEVTRRLGQTIGRKVALFGVVTGPATLARQLACPELWSRLEGAGDLAGLLELSGKIVLGLLRVQCELKVDAVFLADEDLARLAPEHRAHVSPVLKTMRNLTSFYDVRLLVATRRTGAERVPELLELDADGFSLGSDVDLAVLREAALSRNCLFCGCVPVSALEGAPEEVETVVRGLRDKGGRKRLLLTTEWEVPPDTPATNLHCVLDALAS